MYERAELIRCAEAAGDVREVFRTASQHLRRLVPFDAAVWAATDPATGLPTAPTRAENVAHFGGQEACARLWQIEFTAADVHRYQELARADRPAGGLHTGTGGRPARSSRYRELLRPSGFDDELRAVIRADGSPWALLSLFRETGRQAFDERETDLVAGLSGPLGAAIREHAQPAPELAPAGDHGPGLMLFDPGGELISMNDDAAAWLEELCGDLAGDSAFGVRLPLVVVSTLVHARERRTARVRLRSCASGRWLVCHASCLRDADGNRGATSLVIEPAKAAEIAPIVSEAYELSPREREITLLIARGSGTADMAARMHLSAHTVRDYVKAIFEKVGVSSRGELVAKLFAEHYAPLHFAPGADDVVEE